MDCGGNTGLVGQAPSIKVHWCKKAENWMAFFKLACADILLNLIFDRFLSKGKSWWHKETNSKEISRHSLSIQQKGCPNSYRTAQIKSANQLDESSYRITYPQPAIFRYASRQHERLRGGQWEPGRENSSHNCSPRHGKTRSKQDLHHAPHRR